MSAPQSSCMKHISTISRSFMALITITLGFAVCAQASSYKILYSFKGGTDGTGPYSNLLDDGAGGFYGTTADGGSATLCGGFGCGIVYHLSPPSKAGLPWTETILYVFQGSTSDGAHPWGNIVKDSAGNLYGVTPEGGTGNSGIVYKLSPPTKSGEAWTETILHSFSYGTPDGNYPVGGLTWGPFGALYGQTLDGGTYLNGCEDSGCGTIFQVAPPSQPGGAWTESVLYNYEVNPCCGDYPALVYKGGKLYGASEDEGIYAAGSAFEFVPPAGEGQPWSFANLYSFSPQDLDTDGNFCSGSVVFDSEGNAYSTTEVGGLYNWGTFFQLTGSTWNLQILGDFSPTNGMFVIAPLTIDSENNIYGVTLWGGFYGDEFCAESGCGVLFKFSDSGGTWTETVLHAFTAYQDGAKPVGPLTLSKGALYGTTDNGGGTSEFGTVFELVP
jgi:uncharacterized repeat protein (TIGR03803 family)